MFKKKEKRPLFSVIISCYNPGAYLDYLLDSLLYQGIRKDEYEIIISDDCSTESYDDILDKYKKKLNMRYIQSDHNFGYPAHTRQQGSEIAKGEWIIFSDQDDGFFRESFKKVKKYIKEHNSKHVVATGLYIGIGSSSKDSDTVFKRKPYCPNNNQSVTHGIFINKDNVWDKFKLRYNFEDRSLEEDTQIMTELYCLEEAGLIQPDVLRGEKEEDNLYTYCWFMNDDSVSHTINHNCKERDKVELCVTSFLKVKINILTKYYNKGLISSYYYGTKLIDILVHSYASFLFYAYHNKINNIEPLEENNVLLHKLITIIDGFVPNEDLIAMIYSPEMEVRFTANTWNMISIGGKLVKCNVFPLYTIEQFIDMIRNYEPKENTDEEKQ